MLPWPKKDRLRPWLGIIAKCRENGPPQRLIRRRFWLGARGAEQAETKVLRARSAMRAPGCFVPRREGSSSSAECRWNWFCGPWREVSVVEIYCPAPRREFTCGDRY